MRQAHLCASEPLASPPTQDVTQDKIFHNITPELKQWRQPGRVTGAVHHQRKREQFVCPQKACVCSVVPDFATP